MPCHVCCRGTLALPPSGIDASLLPSASCFLLTCSAPAHAACPPVPIYNCAASMPLTWQMCSTAGCCTGAPDGHTYAGNIAHSVGAPRPRVRHVGSRHDRGDVRHLCPRRQRFGRSICQDLRPSHKPRTARHTGISSPTILPYNYFTLSLLQAIAFLLCSHCSLVSSRNPLTQFPTGALFVRILPSRVLSSPRLLVASQQVRRLALMAHREPTALAHAPTQ